MKKTAGTALVASSLLLTTLAGCGSSSLTSTSTAAPASASATVNATLAAKLPASIKSSGIIQIGTDATYAPNEYLNGTEVVGFDVDLFNAVAADLGVKTQWSPANFDSILLGVKAGKYDVGVSSFTINADREKQVTFVQYANVGEQWATLAGNPKNVDSKNPCGLTIAVQTKTVEDDELTADNTGSGICAAKPINILHYDGQDAVNNALVGGKADAMLADYPITQYAIKMTGGKLAPLGDQYGQAPYGYAVTKENQAFAEAMAGALADLKKSGQYDAILAKYGITAAGVSSFAINPPVS